MSIRTSGASFIDGSIAVALAAVVNRGQAHFGAGTLAAGTTSANFLCAWSTTAAPSTTQSPVILPWDIEIEEVRFGARGQFGTSGSALFTIYVNGVATAAAVNVAMPQSSSSVVAVISPRVAVAKGAGIMCRVDGTSVAGTVQGFGVTALYRRVGA